MPVTPPPPAPARQRLPAVLKKMALWVLGLWLAYGLLAYWAAPPLLRALLEQQLGQALQRPVTVQGVAVDPLRGQVRIEGLSVQSRAGQEQMGFDRLDVNLSSLSLLRGALVVDALHLQAPRLQLVRLAPGRYDVSDLLDRWLAPDAAPPTAMPRFSLHNIQISDGRLQLEDRPVGTRHTVQSLRLGLPFISSLPSQAEIWVKPAFSAVVDGSSVSLEGQSLPFSPGHRSELTLALQDLDLARLQAYLPTGLPLRLQAGQLDTRLRIRFEQTARQTPALQLDGSAQLRGLQLHEAAGLPWLALDQLDLRLAPSEPLAGIYALESLALQGLRAGPPASGKPWRVPSLLVQQARLDLPARRLHADAVRGRQIEAWLSRTPQGEWAWLSLPAAAASAAMATPTPHQAPTNTPSNTPASTAPQAQGWQATVGELTLDDMALGLLDQSLSPAVQHSLEHVQLSARQLSTEPAHANAFDLSARLAPSGQIQAKGTLTLAPLALQLQLDTRALPLSAAQPYLTPYLNLTLARGQLSSAGQLVLQSAPQRWQAGYKGSLTLSRLSALDPQDQTEILQWQSLHMGGIELSLTPQKLHIGDIALSDFYARLVLDANGQLNLSHILRAPGPGPAVSAVQAPGQSAQAQASQPWSVQMAKVTLQNGRVNFSDRFVQPPYSATLTRLGGSIENLSSAAGTLARLDLRGAYAGNAPVRISASLNPLAEAKFLDLQADVSSVDLVDFSPYSGKYAGYKIDKGKLSLNARYSLENRQLRADNRLFIDQLTFGEKVESPQATQLPVHLAIALLKNNRGEIDIHLPIAGSLDDPQFSIGGLIFKMVGNLVAKVLTSPFALLGSLFGETQELSQLGFAPGRASLDEAAQHTLQVLAKALREREGLRLEIQAGADSTRDAEGLRRLALERAVLAEKRKALAPGSAQARAPQGLQIEAGEYATYLELAYRHARFPKPRNLLGLPKDLPVQDMENLMLASQTVSEDDLRALATRRAQITQGWLVDQGQIPLSRLFILPVQIGGAGDKPGEAGRNRVDFSLR